MNAVVFLGDGELQIREYEDPAPGPDEVIVRVKASGICGSDLHHLHGPRRAQTEIVIEGHEPCGVVERVGTAVRPSEARIGDRVMVHHYDGCRTCRHCRSGATQFCQRGRTVYGGLNGDGAHADLMKVPAHTLVALPDSLSYVAGAAIACGTGTAFAALRRVGLRADETVAIFGQGPVGMSATILAKALGARVIAVDVEPARLEAARRLGADHVIDGRRDDPVAMIRSLTRDGEGAHRSIECSANATARRQAIESVRMGGTACMVGVFGPLEISSDELIHLHKTIVGSLTFSKNELDECAAFVAERGLDIDSLVTHTFRLEQAAEAYDLFDRRQIGKAVFVFD